MSFGHLCCPGDSVHAPRSFCNIYTGLISSPVSLLIPVLPHPLSCRRALASPVHPSMLSRAPDYPSSSFSYVAPDRMGQRVLKSSPGLLLTPQTSNPSRKSYLDRNLPNIFTVLNQEYTHDYDAQRHNHEPESPENQGGLFLLPVASTETTASALSASSVTKDFMLRDPQVLAPPAGQNFSPLLLLPLEILYQIIEIVYYDESTTSIPANLEKFSKTIPVLLKTFNQLAMRFLYKYAIFNRPHSFDRFLHNILKQPDLGQYVQFMDFQTFTSIGLGRTGRMNQEIQMLTAETILAALRLCPNLVEFLASENIQDDMDVNVLLLLFNRMPKIQALDFCGASLRLFAEAFNQLVIEGPTIRDSDSMSDSTEVTDHDLGHILKISFHDCSNLAPGVFEKVFPHLCHLRRLDVTHTSITSSILVSHIPHSCRLTHLSLARCSKLTTKDLIHFLTRHPAVAQGSLQWLNLQTDSNVVSPLNDQYLMFTLKSLNAPDLRYLNLGGMPVNKSTLGLIKKMFPRLESLAIPHSNIDLEDLTNLMTDNTSIRFLDLTDCKALNRGNIALFLKSTFESNLEAIEFDYKILYDLTGGVSVRVDPVQTDFSIGSVSYLPQAWKFYDNEGRRCWIYKIDPSDPSYDSIVTGTSPNVTNPSNLVYYDLETGAKIEAKVTKPAFLKYASRKINCSVGYYNLKTAKKKAYIEGHMAEPVWPVEFSQRGIYNYYSLNVK